MFAVFWVAVKALQKIWEQFFGCRLRVTKFFDQTGVTRDFCNSLQPTMPLKHKRDN